MSEKLSTWDKLSQSLTPEQHDWFEEVMLEASEFGERRYKAGRESMRSELEALRVQMKRLGELAQSWGEKCEG